MFVFNTFTTFEYKHSIGVKIRGHCIWLEFREDMIPSFRSTEHINGMKKVLALPVFNAWRMIVPMKP